MARIALVACTKLKAVEASDAAHLYTSPLFRAASEYAKATTDEWFILSAKHGLVNPTTVLSPYDESLKGLSSEERAHWADRVGAALRKVLRTGDTVTILAGMEYREFLVPLIDELQCDVVVPLKGLSIGQQLQWLKASAHERNKPYWVNQFYNLLSRLRDGLGGLPEFTSCHGKMPWPKRGLYFFFEPNEIRRDNANEPRVVRLGTHGVSQRSSSTLWKRLYTHRGGLDGSGNHRGSIFRLHVGAAIINRDSLQSAYPSWGRGQHASPETRSQEAPLEKRVSKHIGRMQVAWLRIEDPPGPMSDRRFVEKNSIALLTSRMLIHDQPSMNWLGRFSPHASIRNTGLWNVQDVNASFDPRFLEILSHYVEVTLGHRPHPTEPIAPTDSNNRGRAASQATFFDTE